MFELTKVLPINLKMVDGKKRPLGGLKHSNVVDYEEGMKNFAIYMSDYPDIVVLDLDSKPHPLDHYIDKTYTHETRKGWHCFFQNTYKLDFKKQRQKEKFDLLAGPSWVFFDYDDPTVATYTEYNQLPLAPMPHELLELTRVKPGDTGDTPIEHFTPKPLVDIVKRSTLWDKRNSLWRTEGRNSSDIAHAIIHQLIGYTDDEFHIQAVLQQIQEECDGCMSDKQVHIGTQLTNNIRAVKLKANLTKVNWRPLSDWRTISVWDRPMFADVDALEIVAKYPVTAMTLRGVKPEELQYYTRVYNRMDFMPQYNQKFVTDTYNLWNGWVESIDGQAHQPYLDYMLEVLCSGNQTYYNYLIGWLAHMVQKPAELPRVAVVLHGKDKGTGKDTFHVLYRQMFRKGGFVTFNEETMRGNFNWMRASALSGVAEELVFGGSHKEDSALKTLITGADYLATRKGKEGVTVKNYMRLIISSNHTRPVNATEGERRYFVLEPSPVRKGQTDYWNRLYKDFNPHNLLHYLQNYDLSGFEISKPPETDELKLLIENNKSKLEEAIEDWFVETEDEEFFNPNDLYSVIQSITGDRYLTKRQMTSHIFKTYGKHNFVKSSQKGVNGYKIIRGGKTLANSLS